MHAKFLDHSYAVLYTHSKGTKCLRLVAIGYEYAIAITMLDYMCVESFMIIHTYTVLYAHSKGIR